MQISDMLGQYASTLNNAAGAPASKGPQPAAVQNAAAQDAVSALGGLSEGAIFEGSINSINGTKVMLGLSNGQMIQARLDTGIQLLEGQSMFFQVKANDGNTIAIKPFADAMTFNPTIQKALGAAGLEMNRATVELVNHMMEEGLPIDRNSLLGMHQTLLQNPQVNIQTAIAMTRLGIPVTGQMAAQFENYQNDQHAMLTQMEKVMDALPKVLADGTKSAEGLVQLNRQLMTILGDGAKGGTAPLFLENGAQPAAGEAAADGTAAGTAEQGAAAADTGVAGQNGGQVQPGMESGIPAQTQSGAKAVPDGVTVPNGENVLPDTAKDQKLMPDLKNAALQPQDEQIPVSRLLGKQQTAELEAQLKEVFPERDTGQLNTKLTAKEFLNAVAAQLEQQPSADRGALSRLLSGKGYRALLKQVMEQQWTVRPEELKTEDKVKELYERLNRQMGQIEQFAKQAGMNTGQLSRAAGEVRSNIDFMNQINQAYTYVQIPLKMANQNAHADLYVYTNKRNLQKKEGELSAFLHLDLEHLGSTDVSVKMLDKNVSTKFYLADDASYDLIEQHLPELEAKLNALGYNCRIMVENREEHVDFVEDFLQQAKPQTAPSRGMVHRYSFDVRA